MINDITYISGECSNKPLNKSVDRVASTESEGDGQIPSEDGDLCIVVHNNGKDIDEWVGPHSVVNFTRRTLKPSLLSSAVDDYQFGGDPYISQVW